MGCLRGILIFNGSHAKRMAKKTGPFQYTVIARYQIFLLSFRFFSETLFLEFVNDGIPNIIWNPVLDSVWNPYGFLHGILHGILHEILFGILSGILYGITYLWNLVRNPSLNIVWNSLWNSYGILHESFMEACLESCLESCKESYMEYCLEFCLESCMEFEFWHFSVIIIIFFVHILFSLCMMLVEKYYQ